MVGDSLRGEADGGLAGKGDPERLLSEEGHRRSGVVRSWDFPDAQSQVWDGATFR